MPTRRAESSCGSPQHQVRQRVHGAVIEQHPRERGPQRGQTSPNTSLRGDMIPPASASGAMSAGIPTPAIPWSTCV